MIKNKYSISLLILLLLIAADILLHKGMSRVIIPTEFTEKINPSEIEPVNKQLSITGKEWIKAVNNVSLIKSIPENTAGIECDVYFNMQKNIFEVYHDSSAISDLTLDSLLSEFNNRKLNTAIWLDFKNLNKENSDSALNAINKLKTRYQLQDRMIIESTVVKELAKFNTNGYFTSYYVPFFNPYSMQEDSLINMMNAISQQLKTHPSSAISGYYFQYPVLKKFFPKYPILTWSTRSLSIVSYTFNRQLLNDDMVKVILYPFENN